MHITHTGCGYEVSFLIQTFANEVSPSSDNFDHINCLIIVDHFLPVAAILKTRNKECWNVEYGWSNFQVGFTSSGVAVSMRRIKELLKDFH